MVCSRCQQPAPKRKSSYTARVCDEGLALDEGLAPAPPTSASTAAPFPSDDWAARQRVRTVVRELRRPNPTATNPTIVTERHRFDPPADLFAQLDQATTPTLATIASRSLAPEPARKQTSNGGQVMAWIVVLVGMLGLAGGVALISWSLSSADMMYWNHAIGLALASQATLILGLVLVISRLWRSSRQSAAKLHEVHARLGQLQQTSETMAATRAGGAPAFYADLVRGASPHVMLANLKGQVDQLATRVGTAW
jgi:hypothetical protein